MDLTKAFLLVITSQETDIEIDQAAIDSGLAAPVDSFATEDEANAAKDAWLAKPHPDAYKASVIPNPNPAPVGSGDTSGPGV